MRSVGVWSVDMCCVESGYVLCELWVCCAWSVGMCCEYVLCEVWVCVVWVCSVECGLQ